MINFFKGLLIGAGTIIPGISGGTMAIITGLYEIILDCIANFHKRFKNTIITLFPIISGALTGIFILSIPLEYFCGEFPILSKWVFIASASIGVILFVNSSSNILKNVNIKSVIFLTMGIIIAYLLSMLPQSDYVVTQINPILLFILGFPLALALVLPAVSFSYMLFYIGLYDFVIKAINNLELLKVFPLVLGIAIGTIAFSKLLLRFINKSPQKAYMFVLGFVVYSIFDMIF